MDRPRHPVRALLPARKTVDEESSAQAYHPISDHYPERLDPKQQLISRLFSFLHQDDPTLSTLDHPLVSRPQFGTTTRRRGKASRNDHTQTQATPFQNNKIASMVNAQSERGTGDDIRRIKHNMRVEELKRVLDPISPENGSVVLLCWGDKSSCSILPVKVSNSEDEVATWGEINKAWYTRRGYWTKYLPGFSVTRVDIAKITILGLKEASQGRKKTEYIGMCTIKDIPTEKKRLQDAKDSTFITSDCSYNPSTGGVDCGSGCECPDCVPGIDDLDECPLRILRDARRQLLFLDTLTLMRYVFSNDFLEKGHLVYGHQYFLSKFNTWHSPGLRELKFRGIVISEGWTLGTHQVVLPLMTTMFLLIVIAAKFLFGWDTAWTVGGFFVALATLSWMWATYAAS